MISKGLQIVKLNIIFILLIFLSSCGMKSCLDNRDYDWLIYSEGDSLFFESNLNSFDTIAVTNKRHGFIDYNPFNHGFFKSEIGKIFYTNSRNKSTSGLVDLNSEGWFDGSTIIVNLYNNYFFNFEDSFLNSDETFNYKGLDLDDTIIITANDSINECKSIYKIWWSKSTGIIQYESCEGELWKLEKWKKSNKK